MQKLNQIFTLLISGLSVRVKDSFGNKIMPWTNINETPDFKDKVKSLLDYNDNLRIDIGKHNGKRFNVTKTFVITKDSPLPISEPTPKPLATMENHNNENQMLAGDFNRNNSFPPQNTMQPYSPYKDRYDIVKDQYDELKQEYKEVKTELKEVTKDRDKIRLELSTIEKRTEYETQKQLYNRDNTIAGAFRELRNPETLDALGGVLSVVKGGESNEGHKQMGSIATFSSDAKNAVVEIVSGYNEAQTELLLKSIQNETFLSELEKLK